jgi:hypothetical protein
MTGSAEPAPDSENIRNVPVFKISKNSVQYHSEPILKDTLGTPLVLFMSNFMCPTYCTQQIYAHFPNVSVFVNDLGI